MRRLLLVSLLVGLASMAGACVSLTGKSRPVEVPALNVPPPPPRVVEPPPAEEPEPAPVGDLPAAPTSPPRAPRREAPKPSGETKTEPKPESPPAEQPAAPPPAQAPVPQLSTPQTADSSEAARAVRATIDRARAMLGSVNFRALSNERKKAYNDVKMFLDQAENAVKQGNYTFAQGVATKAETLARELAGG